MTAGFSEAPFDLALGEIYGLRAWRVDDYGRLQARVLEGVPPWRPGVNVADCHIAAAVGGGWMSTLFGGKIIAGGMVFSGSCTCPACSAARSVAPVGEHEQARPEPDHSVPDERCSCGFYAYTYLAPDLYGDVRTVPGVIRGTGRTLIGAKGFRSERAEIVALLDPTSRTDFPVLAEWQRGRLQLLYPDVPLLPSMAELMRFAPIESTAPAPTTDEFWSLP